MPKSLPVVQMINQGLIEVPGTVSHVELIPGYPAGSYLFGLIKYEARPDRYNVKVDFDSKAVREAVRDVRRLDPASMNDSVAIFPPRGAKFEEQDELFRVTDRVMVTLRSSDISTQFHLARSPLKAISLRHLT